MKRKVKCYVTYTMDFEVEAEDDEGAMEAARKQLLPTKESDPYNWLWFSLKSLSELKIQTGAEQESWKLEDLRPEFCLTGDDTPHVITATPIKK